MVLRALLPAACLLAVLPLARLPEGVRPETEARSAPVRDLPFFYDLYTFRGTGDSTAVIAAVAVQSDELGIERTSEHVRYRFDVSFVLSDTAAGSVTRTDDSVYVAVRRPLRGGHLLHTHLEVLAPPSTSTLQRVVMTDAASPGTGQLYAAPFPIPDYTGTRLMLSDIAIGLPDRRGGWERGDVTLALLPTSQLPEGDFDVYYEVYNLPPGARYATDVTIERLDERDVPPVTTRYTGESGAGADGTLPELRRVETSVRRGSYRLTITVTDQDNGRVARRSRLFHVRGWDRGATMVPAFPASREKRATARQG